MVRLYGVYGEMSEIALQYQINGMVHYKSV
jgi:hypothetical protein